MLFFLLRTGSVDGPTHMVSKIGLFSQAKRDQLNRRSMFERVLLGGGLEGGATVYVYPNRRPTDKLECSDNVQGCMPSCSSSVVRPPRWERFVGSVLSVPERSTVISIGSFGGKRSHDPLG